MKILWAVDIFENHPKAINASIDFLQTLSETINIKVDAVTVVHPSVNRIESDVEDLRYNEECLRRLNDQVKNALYRDWYGHSVVHLERQIPQRVAVLNLTEYAKTLAYDAILVVKHSDLSRRPHYLGSFAEMTIFLSTLPVFLINPDGIIPEEIGKILIALDNSSDKEKVFKSLLLFFPVKDINIKLFHRIPIPFYYLSKESIRQWAIDQKKIILNSLQSIKRIAENAGGIIEFDIKISSKKIGESILHEGKKGEFDLIVTIHKGKEAPGYFLGRITRRVLQRADRPVLLFRP